MKPSFRDVLTSAGCLVWWALIIGLSVLVVVMTLTVLVWLSRYPGLIGG